jgi:hypothetical protein
MHTHLHERDGVVVQHGDVSLGGGGSLQQRQCEGRRPSLRRSENAEGLVLAVMEEEEEEEEELVVVVAATLRSASPSSTLQYQSSGECCKHCLRQALHYIECVQRQQQYDIVNKK